MFVALAYYESAATRLSKLFFFFQAEDGIRDLTVTGVQTCALPIFEIAAGGQTAAGLPEDRGRHFLGGGLAVAARHAHQWAAKMRAPGPRGVLERSEERRVGKEGRSRWSPYH